MSPGRPVITARERDRIETLLRTVTIFEAQRIAKRPFSTLAKIAEAVAQ